MRKILLVFRMINILSLDVAAGAMICASFFARVFDVIVLPQGLISLGLTVWIIYTADHLLDAKKIKETASTERHRFHQRHFKILAAAMALAALVDVAQIYFMSSVVVFAGLALSIIITIYFLIQQRLGFLKELVGTLLYAGGVLLIPLSLKNWVPTHFILLIFQFVLTVWINLLLFSWIGQPQDEADKHRSFATTFGKMKTQIFLWILFIIIGILSLFQLVFFSSTANAVFILTLMNAVLLIIFLNKKYFEEEDRYRSIGDAVFFLPLLYILI